MAPKLTAMALPSRPLRWLVLTLSLCLLTGCQQPGDARTKSKGVLPDMDQRIKAPELDKGSAWLNTDHPLSLQHDLKGQVVLLDFWTYCCINCIHVLPDLKFLEHKYKDQPFAVVGVHSAKFENEGTRQNVRSAILRYEIEHPVVVDDQMALWQRYGIRSWPSLVLIDSAGRVVGVAPGEGNREILDRAIDALLEEGRRNKTLAAGPLKLKREGQVRAAGGLSFPGKVAADEKTRRVFVADSNHNRIVVSEWPDEQGHARLIQVIGQGQAGQKDGPATEARFDHPQGLAVGKELLYVADTEAHTIRRVSLKDWSVKTIAGTGKQDDDRTGGGTGTRQGLNSPWDLALSDDEKLLYIAMAGPHQIWVMDLQNNKVRRFAGSGNENLFDGPAEQAALAQPSGLALHGNRLYFADSEVSAVRYVDLTRREVNTVIGEGLFEFGDRDGRYPSARLQHALGVAAWGGQLLVADTYNHKIKLVDPVAKSSATFLGLGKPAAQDGPALGLYEPGGLAVSGGELFVADTNNHRLVRVNLQTNQWQEVVVEGLTPPEHLMKTQRDAVTLTDPATIDPQKPLALTLHLEMPKGYGLNAEAPTSLRVSSGEKTLLSQTTHTRSGELSAELPPGWLKPGETTTLQVQLRTAYCQKEGGGVCLPFSATWQTPVSTGEDTRQTLDFKTTLPAVKSVF